MSEGNIQYNRISEIMPAAGQGYENNEFLAALEIFIEEYKKKSQNNGSLLVPIEIFSEPGLGILEALAKYLHENLNMPYSEIARIIRRDPRTIWKTHFEARKKHSSALKPKNTAGEIPLSIFSDRKLGPLEALVMYQREALGMSFGIIAARLGRTYGSVWLTYRNARRKLMAK